MANVFGLPVSYLRGKRAFAKYTQGDIETLDFVIKDAKARQACLM